MTLRSEGEETLPQQFEGYEPRTLEAVGKAVGLWAALAAIRYAAAQWAPSPVAEGTVVVWAVALFPVMWLASRRGALGAWGAVAGFVMVMGSVETVVLDETGAGVVILGGLSAAGLVMAAGTARLVNESDRRRRRAVRAALEDPESGLLSRRGLELVLDKEVGEARRGGELSVVLLALAGYDRLMEGERDIRRQVLAKVGEALTTNSRDMDTVGRLEENRFLAVLPDTGLQGGATFAGRVCTKLASIAVTTDGRTVIDSGIEARAGLASWAEDLDADQGSLLDRAEEALQSALSGEHGRVVDEKHVRSHRSGDRSQ